MHWPEAGRVDLLCALTMLIKVLLTDLLQKPEGLTIASTCGDQRILVVVLVEGGCRGGDLQGQAGWLGTLHGLGPCLHGDIPTAELGAGDVGTGLTVGDGGSLLSSIRASYGSR